MLSALLSEAFEETDGLQQLLERHVDDALLEEVAREYARGRLLILATTHMDAERPMLWSMGRIAASGRPDASQLFRDVMVASAAIPGAFGPVLLEVEADGERYDEMHCDGGVTSQVFPYPPASSFADLPDPAMAQRERYLYVIRNAKLRREARRVLRPGLHERALRGGPRVGARRRGVAEVAARIPSARARRRARRRRAALKRSIRGPAAARAARGSSA